MNGREAVRQILGSYRSFASKAAHSSSDIDEEELFRLISDNFIKGFKTELVKTFGWARTTRMLNPFKNNG